MKSEAGFIDEPRAEDVNLRGNQVVVPISMDASLRDAPCLVSVAAADSGRWTIGWARERIRVVQQAVTPTVADKDVVLGRKAVVYPDPGLILVDATPLADEVISQRIVV